MHVHVYKLREKHARGKPAAHGSGPVAPGHQERDVRGGGRRGARLPGLRVSAALPSR
jgi:hypothetical protein